MNIIEYIKNYGQEFKEQKQETNITSYNYVYYNKDSKKISYRNVSLTLSDFTPENIKKEIISIYDETVVLTDYNIPIETQKKIKNWWFEFQESKFGFMRIIYEV